MGAEYGYIYAAAMFIAGIFIIYFSVKENKLFCIVGVYFLLLGIYWLINTLTPQLNLFDGVYGTVFRCVTGAVAVIAIILYIIQRRRNSGKY